MTKRKILDIIISVVLAIGIWAYVVLVVNPISSTMLRSIPVHLLNVDLLNQNGLAIAGSGEYTVDVSLSGRRTDINSVAAADLSANADLSGLGVGQHYVNVIVEAPGSLEVTEVRTQRIQIYIEQLVAMERPVVTIPRNLAEGLELGSMKLSSETLVVSGAKSLVDSVDHIAVSIDAQGIPADGVIDTEITAIPVNADGNRVNGVTLSSQTVKVRASAYAVKQIAFVVAEIGDTPQNIEIISRTSPESVVLKGPSEALADVWSISCVPVNLTLLTQTGDMDLELELPEDVELSELSEQPSVRYVVKRYADTSYSFEASEILIEGLGEEQTASLLDEGPVTVSFHGEENAIFALSRDRVSLHIDASGLEAGRQPVTITVELPDSLRDRIDASLEQPEVFLVIEEPEPVDPDEENGEEGAEGAESGESLSGAESGSSEGSASSGQN